MSGNVAVAAGFRGSKTKFIIGCSFSGLPRARPWPIHMDDMVGMGREVWRPRHTKNGLFRSICLVVVCLMGERRQAGAALRQTLAALRQTQAGLTPNPGQFYARPGPVLRKPRPVLRQSRADFTYKSGRFYAEPGPVSAKAETVEFVPMFGDAKPGLEPVCPFFLTESPGRG